MHSNDNIQNELKELNSLLAGISNENVYSVPAGYFEVLAHDILLAVQDQEITFTGQNQVPVGYFEGLADAIMAKIKFNSSLDEEMPALLSNLKNIQTYRIPAGYFENLSTDIINSLPHPAPVIIMKKRSTFFNYAAAAVITGMIGLSVISIFDNSKTTESNSKSSLVMAQAKNILNTNSFDEVLSTVGDGDIVNYLQNHGQDVNAALVASVTDDKNLPDQVDYLADEKTLDNLLIDLKSIESTNN